MTMGKQRNVRRLGVVSLVLVVGMIAAACSSSTTSGTTTTSGGNVPTNIKATSFTSDFSVMTSLRSLASQGHGMIGALLPDTASSARYVSFDAPYLAQAFQKAGLTSSQYKIDNAQGSDSTELTQAQADITAGATVLLMDGLDSGVGSAIESYAKSHGVKVIDYDRISLGGSRDYYVSFDNVKVGQLIGQGAVDCISSWNVTSPHVFELDGSPTDNNATLFAQGYNSVLSPKYTAGTYTKVGEQAVPNWDNQQALTLFQQQYTAHKDINVVVAANDGLGNSVISALKTANVPAKKIPVTGQDATLQGMQNVLSGYQCGSVYKPIYLEAQAAVALALYLRAGKTPPSGLVNGTVKDTTGNVNVPSVLLTPVWVTAANMNATVIKDKFIPASTLCAGTFASDCTQVGITP
ncbi:MAG TPA: substrate-binding domain-containing protein [Acidimicrobiales bacterium]|nr:substrate-binding domain-containing protein [Acidimicrobiales bacterium]